MLLLLRKQLFYGFVVNKLKYASNQWFPLYTTQELSIMVIQLGFFKFLSSELNGSYANLDISYSDLITLLQVETLIQQRMVQTSRFLHKLLTNEIDCPSILSDVSFKVSRLSSRNE